MKKMLRTLLVVGLLPLVVLGLVQVWPRPPLASALTTPDAPATRLVCYGYVDSRHGQIHLQPARPGRVVQVLVKEKQIISKDAPLVQLDDQLLQLQEQEAELSVQSAEVQLTKAQNCLLQHQAKNAQAQAALRLAQTKLRMAKDYLTVKQGLLKDGVSNKGQLDLSRDQVSEAEELVTIEQNKLAELNAANPELEAKLAQLQLEGSKVQVRRAVRERGEYLLRAPVDGQVIRVQAQEGDLVGPATPRPAILLAPAGAWIVRAEVSQEFAGRVQEALDVQVEDEASAVLLGKGRIAEVSEWFLPRRQFDARPSGINTSLFLECVIDLHEGHAPLRLGQRVRVRVLEVQHGSVSSK